jgi:DNA-binding response OmpR family regulator
MEILLIEDNREHAVLITEAVRRDPKINATVRHVETMTEARAALAAGCFQLFILDVSLPDLSPSTMPAAVRELSSHGPVIVMTGSEDPKGCLAAMDAHAADYIGKDVLSDHRLLGLKILRAVSRHASPGLADGVFDKQIEIAEIRASITTTIDQNKDILEKVGEVKVLATATNGRVGKLESWKAEEIERQAKERQQLADQAAYGRGASDAENAVKQARAEFSKRLRDILGLLVLAASTISAIVAAITFLFHLATEHLK